MRLASYNDQNLCIFAALQWIVTWRSNYKLCMSQFFAEFNSKLILSASNYFIRRQAIQVRSFPFSLFSIVYFTLGFACHDIQSALTKIDELHLIFIPICPM